MWSSLVGGAPRIRRRPRGRHGGVTPRRETRRYVLPVNVLAAIDVGTNTTRSLVARPDGGRLERLAARAVMTGLGQGLEATGRIGPEALDAVESAAAEMAAEARRLGADRLVVGCTAVARDAANGDELVRRLEAATGVAPRVLSGDEEARLTFLGLVAAGAPDPLLACDLGGGSLEIMGGEGGRLAWSVSLPLGTRRLTERFALPDPPPLEEAGRLIALVQREVGEAVAGRPAGGGVAAGGSAAAVARLAGTEELDAAALRTAIERLAGAPAAEVAARSGLSPERARLSFAGAAAYDGVRRALDLPSLRASEAGVREGLVLEAAAA
jgi:exopolyphosphatase / guanosine-5'-triphosphate,3'-diphosphate pyrophosphatase